MRHSGIITIILVSLAFVFLPEADAATFTVKVQNETKEEVLVKYPVTLSVGNKGGNGKFKSVNSVELLTEENGMASGKIDPLGARLIRAEVVYRGVPYHSEFAQISTGKSTQDYTLQVPVYEITNDNSSVYIDSRSMVIMTKNDRTLEVYETLVVTNLGNKTYVGRFNDELDLNQVLYIPMPRGYMLYGFSGYETPKLRTLGRGIATQNEVIPGTKEIKIHYYVQSDIGEFDLELLSQKGAPEINTFTLFFPKENAWKLKQSGLKKSGEEFINKIPYTIMKGVPGSIVRLKVFGPTYKGGFGLWHLSIILAFVLAVFTLFMARENIRARVLVKEEQRLENLLDDLQEELQESEDEKSADSYASYKQVVKKRLTQIEEYFEQE